jgi:hypothetical protein
MSGGRAGRVRARSCAPDPRTEPEAVGGGRTRAAERDARPRRGGSCGTRRAVVCGARRGRRGALVLGATRRVTYVVLCKEPSPLELRGTTVIVGLAGCFFLPSASPVGVVVFLDRLRGAVLGGGLAEGGLVVAQTIVVMVATFVGSGCSFLAAWPDTGGAMACRSGSPVPDVPTAQRKHTNRPAPLLPWSRCARVVAAVSGGGCVDGVPLW